MSRPWLLVCLLLLIVFTSQFEWKQQYGNQLEASPVTSNKLHSVSQREEYVKEKIILSQEKSIQKLKELVQNLSEQLLQCRSENEFSNGTTTSLTDLPNDIGRHPVLED